MFGFVNTYYIKDQDDFDINDIPIEDKDRGTILWRHRQELPYDWRLDMEYSYLSDPRFLREYFEHQFKEEKTARRYCIYEEFMIPKQKLFD